MIPEVSIVIPHKNRWNLLLQTLKSIAYQTFENWEVIIVDDYSEETCLTRITNQIADDERFTLVTKTNEKPGAPVSRNMGLNQAKGFFIIFLDSDDILAPFALEQRIMAFQEDTNNLQAVAAPTILFNSVPGDLKNVLNTFDHKKEVMTRFTQCDNMWITMTTMWKKAFLLKIQGWDEELSSYQDWELHLRALLNGLAYKEIDTYDSFYRIDSDDQSIASNFFKESVTKGRFNAFLKVTVQIKKTENKAWIRNLRGVVIRNFILLIDNNKLDISKQLLKNYQAYNLNVFDVAILNMIKRDPNSWRYRRITMYAVRLFWQALNYDPWKKQDDIKKSITTNHRAMHYNYAQLLS